MKNQSLNWTTTITKEIVEKSEYIPNLESNPLLKREISERKTTLIYCSSKKQRDRIDKKLQDYLFTKSDNLAEADYSIGQGVTWQNETPDDKNYLFLIMIYNKHHDEIMNLIKKEILKIKE